MPTLRALAAVLLALLVVPAAAVAAKPQPKPATRAGAASADITAPVGTPMFAYTARSYIFSPDPDATQQRALQMIADPDTGLYAKSFEPSRGIHTRVLARAIVLESHGRKYALAQADLGGLPYAMTQEVLERIAPTGIDGEHLLLSATHTHSSMGNIWPADNGGYAFVGGDAFDPRTFEQTAQGIAEAIVAADRRLKPARVGVGTAQLTDASRNREYAVHLRNHDVAEDPAEQRAQSIDPTVTVVRVDDADGVPMAVWSNFAIHPTSFGDGNLLFSGDNAGVATRLTEQEIQGHADRLARRGQSRKAAAPVVNVWTNGAEGDTSPDGDNRRIGDQPVDYVPSDAAQAHLAGKRTAAGILRAWRDAGARLEGDVGIAARRTFFTFDGAEYGPAGGGAEPVGPYPVLGAGVVAERRPSLTSPGADEPNCAPVENLAGPGQGEKMPLIGGPGLAPTTMPVSFWRIGRLGIAAYPSEITKQMGQRIRDALLQGSAGALDRVAIAGLTNAYLSYTATPEEYSACTYEGSFTLMGRQMGYAWLAAGAMLEAALLKGEPAPAGIEPPKLGFGTKATTPARETPKAGTAIEQPADTARYGRAVFRFNGGDPQVDARRGKPFVSLQRRGDDGWETLAADESFLDTTERSAGDVWTETFQFDGCAPTGTYRFKVTGRAVRAAGERARRYRLTSAPFSVSRLEIAAGTASVADGVAKVRPLYPDPGSGALLALPRLVRDAAVRLSLSDGRTVTATDPDDDGLYTAAVGSAGVRAVGVRDACGNTAG
jgi:neutral ceramidase